MSWTYRQSTGELSHNGVVVGTGYSGAGTTTATGRNNPLMQGAANQGPIPTGTYHVGPAYHNAHTGPTSMNLTPMGHNARGRSGFMIHGDNRASNASQGCVIMPPAARQQVANSGDTTLVVVP